jgi:hypothetical protein
MQKILQVQGLEAELSAFSHPALKICHRKSEM